MTSESEARRLPLALKVLGSAFVLGHFLVLGAHVLNQRSGPWPSPFGPSEAEPPQFATAMARPGYDNYLKPLAMTHNYHFATNRVSVPEVKFEIKLFDPTGRVMETLQFPEAAGNPWVRHRFDLLAMNLARDLPVQPNMAERVGGKDGNPDVEIWGEPDAKGVQRLKTVAQNLIPRDGAFRPSPWAKAATQSYIRHLCRVYGASSGELIRRSRNAVQPSLLFLQEIPRDQFQEMVVSFGKYTP